MIDHGIVLTGEARLRELVEVGLRRNPKRAHLLVSTVLGKHVPADPRLVHDTGRELGQHVRKVVGDAQYAVLGFAETATGLGHCVAEALDAPYLHSTRRRVATAHGLAAFEEEHSHASAHRLLPEDPALLDAAEVLVLADDELSTGRTAMNTIAALHAQLARERYVIAALVDLRGPADRAALAGFAGELGAEISVVSLASGRVDVPPGIVPPPDRGPARRPGPHAAPRSLPVRWRAPDGGRHGVTAAQTAAMRADAAELAAHLPGLGDDVLVLGTEELMYAPILLGVELAARGVPVRVSSTTRSPVVALDEPGYPVRSVLTFPAHDGTDDAPRYAYNVARREPWSDIVVVVDADGDTDTLRTGLLAELARCAGAVHLVVLPTRRPLPEPLRGPGFGSYRAEDAAWLLTDLSEVTLEAPTEEREEAIQSGGAHYAESLPVEFRPDAGYLRLFEAALADSAAQIAHAVGVVTELVVAERGPAPVLASLARAGTPVGVLMRRWAAFAHGLDLPHYAVSIVRGRGIDEVALRYLAARHDPSAVVFVDGWTGKGAIARELAAAVATANDALGTSFDPGLAVLADPGSCVSTYGTREDFLVPSACLNSTVSGLVSRTVLNPAVLAPGQFHGAKFYRELASDDVSHRFVDAVTDRFDEVAGAVARDWPRRRRADRTPTWAGWTEIEQISAKYEIGDVTLVKPGVGETTRVLLRRVPWAVLVRTGATGLEHVRHLAERRGVPVHEVDELTYRCVGLIHPRYTRGATGADGRRAT